MMFAGKTTFVNQDSEETPSSVLTNRAGLYIDFAVDAKYAYAINEKVSLAGLAGLELVSGYMAKNDIGDSSVSTLYNVAFGLNLGVEGSYKITDKISVVGGATGSWFFVNVSKAFDTYREGKDKDDKFGVASFYIRPYVGATYSF